MAAGDGPPDPGNEKDPGVRIETTQRELRSTRAADLVWLGCRLASLLEGDVDERDEGWETVVGFAYEGGGVTVEGRRRPDDTWALRYSWSSRTLDANDDEEWVSGTREIDTLAGAFEGCARSFGAMVPEGPVHSGFRDQMRAIVRRLAPAPGDPLWRAWGRNRERWRQACEA